MTQKAVTKTVCNLSGYHFTPLEPQKIKEILKDRGRELGVLGTVLLSQEGINCFFAGDENCVTQYTKVLFEEAKIPPFELKKSYSDYVPFKKLLVRVKKEIISTGRDDLCPAKEKAPYVTARELHRAYAAKEDFIILDTRNDYEIKLGKFRNAVDLNVCSFRKFVSRVNEIPQEWKKKRLITYCTGGIRCEKAALLLQKNGFESVEQLEGGILKYFEECGSEFFEGECFVFDKRIGVDADLAETDTTQCYACRTPLLPQDLQNEYYVPRLSCGSCKKVKRFDT